MNCIVLFCMIQIATRLKDDHSFVVSVFSYSLLFRHIVFAPSSKNYYAADAFPGIVDAMYRIDEAPDQDARWDIVRQQMAVTTHAIQSAVSTLQDVLAFDG